MSGFANMDYIRIAPTLAGLANGYLGDSWELPDPVLPVYNESATRSNRADGGQSLRGQRSVVWVWNNIGPIDAYTIRKIVEDAIDGGGLIYATINLNWSMVGAPNYWIDIKGTAILPTSQPAENTEGSLQSQVTLTINQVEIVNDPASF
jgi:hypothetical protein